MRVRRPPASGCHRATRRAGAGVPRGLLVAALALVVGPLAAGAALALASTGGATVAPRPVGDPKAVVRTVVEGWDARRAAAYATGDVAAVARLYPAGSALGEEDAGVLAAYVERGLTVNDLRFAVRDVTIEEATPDRVVVVVTDRMDRAEVRRGDGSRVARLPGRGEAQRRLVLERRDGAWTLVSSGPGGPGVTPSEPVPP
ncbi:MAG: hypothetical protein PIR53_05270 [Nocardioides alkalitolerans]